MNKCFAEAGCKKVETHECPFPEFCIKNFKLNTFYNAACLSEKMKLPINVIADPEDQASFDLLENQYLKKINDFVDSGENLYLYSPITGNGKTAWAVKLLKAYIGSIWHKHDLSTVALFINVPRYLLSIKDSIKSKNDYAEHIKETVMDCPLVVWDDIATKDSTEFERENLLSIIDYRFNSGLSNIFTSNADPSDLWSAVGKRLGSRILGNTTQIQFTGRDQRLK